MKKQPTHGGARHGSGRPAPLGRKSAISVSLTPDVQEFLATIHEQKIPSRSEFIDGAVRATEAFKIWQTANK